MMYDVAREVYGATAERRLEVAVCEMGHGALASEQGDVLAELVEVVHRPLGVPQPGGFRCREGVLDVARGAVLDRL